MTVLQTGMWTILLTLQLCSHGIFVTGSRQNFLITLPETVYVEQENLIAVRAFDAASEVKLVVSLSETRDFIIDEHIYTITLLGDGEYGVDVPYRPPVLPPNGEPVQLNFNFTIDFCNDTKCEAKSSFSKWENAQLVQRAVLILSEIEKPIYRPGDTVRMRFLALSPQLTIPQSTTIIYPKKRLVHMGRRQFELQDISEDERRSLTELNFEEIIVMDSKNNHVKKWLHVPPAIAATLNYTIFKDAPQGQWSVVAKCQEVTERVTFTVKQYVLPRFLVNIKTPENLTPHSNHTQFTICSKYTDGLPMQATVRAVLCVCDRSLQSGITTDEQQTIIGNRTCPNVYRYSRTGGCVESRGSLVDNGCSMFNVSTRALGMNNQYLSLYGHAPIVCAEVFESGTDVNVSKCEAGKFMTIMKHQLEFDFPHVFRPGLPISGQVRVKNFARNQLLRAYVKLHLIQREQRGCWINRRSVPMSEKPIYLLTLLSVVDENGTADFSIPPTPYNQSIHLKAFYIQKSQSSLEKEDKLSSTEQESSLSDSLQDVELMAHHVIRPFFSNSQKFLQPWPTVETIYPKCPGKVQLRLLSNTPLDDKILHIQSVVRGRLIRKQVPARKSTPISCTHQDGILGHYTCDANGTIRCLSGWTGLGCLTPVCAEGCHPIGGSCNVPGKCLCNEGWNGALCTTCRKRDGCVHGVCEHGNDCVCEAGWFGYLCDRPEITHEYLPDGPPEPQDSNSTTTKRPSEESDRSEHDGESVPSALPDNVGSKLFDRQIEFDIDANWGPKATIVIYFYYKFHDEVEIVPMTVKIDGIDDCSSPAAALSTRSDQNGIHFSRYYASPGSLLNFTVSLENLTESDERTVRDDGTQLDDRTCFVRISDQSLSNFEDDSVVLNLQRYAAKLIQLHQPSSIWKPEYPSDATQAFAAAGLRVLSKYVLEHIQPICLSMLRYSLPGDPNARYLSVPQALAATALDNAGYESITGPKPRLRDFFPEVWMFDIVTMEPLDQRNGSFNYGFRRLLTAPDSITSWRASAFCTTASNGLWVPPSKQLTVTMPFYVEVTVPKQVKRGEILHLPVSIFVNPGADNLTNDGLCMEFELSVTVDDVDWVRLGPTMYEGCACPTRKKTFQLVLLPKRLGTLNLTVTAHAQFGGSLCASNYSIYKNKLSDMVRRQLTVVPEGITQEQTSGSLICLKPQQTTIFQEFSMHPPADFVPGSLRVYVSYSDEVLGPALKNLDALVRLPVGCGEQNMVLVAPNVYVLEYLKSVPVVNPKETERLIRQARNHILTGYEQQLKYRHDDGSYSAFGHRDGLGSTWLTAFVLRVFARAYQVDPTIPIDWRSLVNETAVFLAGTMDSLGCFVEKGRVIHSAMQGGLGSSTEDKKSLLLNSYVLAALHEIKGDAFANITEWKTAQLNGGSCLRKLVNSANIKELGTYELAQLAYTMYLLDPKDMKTHMLQNTLLNRSHSGDQLFWAAENSEPTTASATAADIEVTSYAYLALTQAEPPVIDPFAVIRWLATQQTASGGFRSTQDTVLALQVIADGAKRLNLGTSASETNNLTVTIGINPTGPTVIDTLTEEKRRVFNQFHVHIVESQPLSGFRWNLTRAISTGTQCLSIKNSLFYNIRESSNMKNPSFSIAYAISQGDPAKAEPCYYANMSVCIRMGSDSSTRREETGMLIVQLHAMSGWKLVKEKLTSLITEDMDAPRVIEHQDGDSATLYFDGFSAAEAEAEGGWDMVKRCFSVDMEQRLLIEKAKPGGISVTDYYAPDRKLETTYTLADCRSHWVEDGPITELMTTTTQSPTHSTDLNSLACANCIQDDPADRPNMGDMLYEALCNADSNMYVLELNVTSNRAKVTSVSPHNYTSSWSAAIDVSDPEQCQCVWLQRNNRILLISKGKLPITVGQSTVILDKMPPGTYIFHLFDVLEDVKSAADRLVEEMKKWGDATAHKYVNCKRIQVLYRYMKYKK